MCVNVNNILCVNDYYKFINDALNISIEDELWEEHPLYNGYFGSNFGRVKYYNKNQKQIKIKIQYLDKRHNRFKIHIWKEKQHTIDSARFIAECFYGINKHMFVDHINSEPWFNIVTNLRYVTIVENNNNPNSKNKYTPSKTTNDFCKIEQIDKETNKVIKIWEKFRTIETELKLPYNAHKNIISVCNGRQKTAYNYKWRYAKDDDIEGEIWKSHPNLNLECSNKGRVRWLMKNQRLHITNGGKHPCGYLMVQFDGKKYLVHRLIGETFLDNTNNKPQINHIDGNPYNNMPENLEWCTIQENMLSEKTHNKLSHKIKSIDQNGIETHYSSIREARRNGFCGSCIKMCIDGIQSTHKGLKWAFDS